MEAAYKPEVNGVLDTQNFMKFDEVMCSTYSILPLVKKQAINCFVRLGLTESIHLQFSKYR